MARGKYSPTVVAAYRANPGWWDAYAKACCTFGYDVDGFDSYGYNVDDIDRAGNNEFDYLCSDAPLFSEFDYNDAYDRAVEEWGFDGTKPVKV